MSALKKIIICIMLTGFLATAVPQSAKAQFLAFAPSEIATAIKRFMGDVQNSKVIVFATKSAEKIKGALGDFNAAMSSFLNNHLLERMQDVKRAKCKFDQKQKKLKCSSAFQTYKKVKNKAGEGKELIDRGNKLISESKELKAQADKLVSDAKASAEKVSSSVQVIKEAEEAYSEINRLWSEASSIKNDYETMKTKAEDTIDRAKALKEQAESMYDKSKTILEQGNNLRKEGQDLISQAAADPKNAKELKDSGDAKIKQAEQLFLDAKKMEDEYNSLKGNADLTLKQGESLKDDVVALKVKAENIGKEACQLYTKYFSTEESRAKAAAEKSDSCDMGDADISGAMKEKIDQIKDDYHNAMDKAEEYQDRAKALYDQAQDKADEGAKLLKDAKSFAGSLRNCKAGEDPDKDNCYAQDQKDIEYCKADPEKDASDYCDKKYPKKNKTDTAAAAGL